MKELKKECGATVREVVCYCEMSTSTLYAAEKGDEMALSSFLRLFSFYLSEKGYAFDYQMIARLISECTRLGGTLSLSLEGVDDCNEERHLLLGPRESIESSSDQTNDQR